MYLRIKNNRHVTNLHFAKLDQLRKHEAHFQTKVYL